MLILSEVDRADYFPSVPLIGGALNQAIALAQAEAESIARRPLDRQLFDELWIIPPLRKFYLRCWPVELETIRVESGNEADPDLPGHSISVQENGMVTVNDPSLKKVWIRYWSDPGDRIDVKASIAAILLYQQP
jgi:hypothetical protein